MHVTMATENIVCVMRNSSRMYNLYLAKVIKALARPMARGAPAMVAQKYNGGRGGAECVCVWGGGVPIYI